MKKFKYTKIPVIALVAVALFAILPKLTIRYQIYEEEKLNKKTLNEIIEDKADETHYIPVNFICQAPLQTEKNWELHEESCEEAAVLQAYLYENNKAISKEQANEEILKMIDWQKRNFGTHKDLYADELKEFIIKYYNLQEDEVAIIFDASLEDIKKKISKNHPVIVPITGEILNNPYYPYPGYHMLIVIGYSEDRIITNDNGTRRGANYSYDNKIFEKAFRDAGGDILYFALKD